MASRSSIAATSSATWSSDGSSQPSGEPPKPRWSGVITRTCSPRELRCSSHIADESGNACSMTTGSPAPASRTCRSTVMGPPPACPGDGSAVGASAAGGATVRRGCRNADTSASRISGSTPKSRKIRTVSGTSLSTTWLCASALSHSVNICQTLSPRCTSMACRRKDASSKRRPNSVWKVTWNASARAGSTRPVVMVSTSATGIPPHVALPTSTFSRPAAGSPCRSSVRCSSATTTTAPSATAPPRR